MASIDCTAVAEVVRRLWGRNGDGEKPKLQFVEGFMLENRDVQVLVYLGDPYTEEVRSVILPEAVYRKTEYAPSGSEEQRQLFAYLAEQVAKAKVEPGERVNATEG